VFSSAFFLDAFFLYIVGNEARMTYRRLPIVNGFSYVPHAHHKDQDVFIDMQNAKHGFDDPIAYATEPWRHCSDHTNCYLGLRFDKRTEFKNNLDAKRLKRVLHEEERIEQTRVNFAAYPRKQRMMERLKRARREWKIEVKERRKEYVETIQSQDRQPRYPKSWSRSQTLDLELLKRVEDWKVDDNPEDPKLKPKPEMEYGFKACAIYFKKSEDGWKPDTYKHPKFLPEGKFPNQKISVHDLLQDTEDNPLSEPCKEDQLRYFHFPSNNMRWIEV
jgi:hypothetical protein